METILLSRLSFVFVLVCAAVESFIRAAPAEKAYPYTAPLDSEADSTLMMYRRFGLPPSEPGTINTGTIQSWKARGGDAPPVIHLPPNLLRKEPLNYNLNSRHNPPHHEAMSQVHGGQRLAEIKAEVSTRAWLIQKPHPSSHTASSHQTAMRKPATEKSSLFFSGMSTLQKLPGE
uniref:Uncharacterized protein n=1 Tax=Knipowitschia caucasica TaxID=637954 RepID=A0AAV2KPI3_KNICA